MSREILFRGKTGKGNWCSGYIGGSKEYPEFIFSFDDFIGIKVIPETVGQYTGLTDKNGVKIFEGDIVRQGNGNVQVVEWHCWDYDDEFDNVMIGTFMCKDKQGEYFYISKYDEVIGNIHDQDIEELKNGQ